MSSLKTKPNDGNVGLFIDAVPDASRKADANQLLIWMEKITGSLPVMWGNSIVGFGKYHYVYDSGREGDWFIIGFSPRKQNLTIYFMGGFRQLEEEMKMLGKFKTGKSCLYINKLSDINSEVLKEMLTKSFRIMQEKYHS